MKIQKYEFDLSTPRNQYEITESGTSLVVETCTGEAYIQLDDKNNGVIPLHSIGGLHNASFNRIYLSNPAQPGEKVVFYIAYDAELSRNTITLEEIKQLLSEQNYLVNTFTAKQIISQLITANAIVSDMIAAGQILA
ncbi:MAG TPA: hypothetical protein DCG38_05070, partial [Eubacteriaceae bacterium]|nr:hypothetical protein [Eubacteriaceae bacterium]